MEFGKLKILPVLILVVLLSFAVRLADMALDFSGRPDSGRAMAESAADLEPASGEAEIVDDEPPAIEEGENHEEGQGDSKAREPDAAGAPPVEAGPEGGEWKDAWDSDLDFSGTKMELFEDLSKRRQEIEKREKELIAREAILKAAEQELERKYQELAQLRAKIENLLQQQSEEEQARIKSLVKIYENMKPKQAARIFDTLDLDILVAVAAQMSERRLSPVLAAMNPERARTVTIMLAEQKQLPDLPAAN